MYQNNYSYYPQTPQNQNMRFPAYTGLKGRPVSSIEEARAQSIDFDGSVFYFPDIANKRIYTKQINMDGTALMNVYEIKEMPVPTLQEQAFNVNPQNFVTREEFNQAIIQLREALSKEPIVQVSPVGEPAAAAEKPSLALNF